MSSTNFDAQAGQGEFRARKPGSEPLITKGHAPSIKVGNDAAPEFHAEAHPAGTAPAQDTFQPNPIDAVPGQAQNPNMDQSARADPLDFPGATSGDIHNQSDFGKPGQGMTSQEMHGGKRKKERSGLDGLAAGGTFAEGDVEDKARRVDAGFEVSGVENAVPGRAEELAAERR